jgi:hypothetical protein
VMKPQDHPGCQHTSRHTDKRPDESLSSSQLSPTCQYHLRIQVVSMLFSVDLPHRGGGRIAFYLHLTCLLTSPELQTAHTHPMN